MDKTVTGSVADIRAPNIRHSTNGSLYMRYIRPPRYLQQPVTIEEDGNTNIIKSWL
jgi:hypothetical protein